MTHYTMLLKFDGKITHAEGLIEEMLAPYYEELEVEPYKVLIEGEDLERMVKHYKTDNIFELASKMREWSGCEGVIEDGKLYRISTYNPKSKWDWYSIGGRWSGKLKLKKGSFGIKGRAGIFKNEVGIDVAYLKNLDMRYKVVTHGVLDKEGWHEPSKMGWWAITYDETEDGESWDANYKDRFLKDFNDNTIVALVDCHI